MAAAREGGQRAVPQGQGRGSCARQGVRAVAAQCTHFSLSLSFSVCLSIAQHHRRQQASARYYLTGGRSSPRSPRDATASLAVADGRQRRALEQAVGALQLLLRAPRALPVLALLLLLRGREKEPLDARRPRRRRSGSRGRLRARLAPRRTPVRLLARVRALGAEPVLLRGRQRLQVRAAAGGAMQAYVSLMSVSRTTPTTTDDGTHLRWKAAGHPSQQMSSPLSPQRWHASSFRSFYSHSTAAAVSKREKMTPAGASCTPETHQVLAAVAHALLRLLDEPGDAVRVHGARRRDPRVPLGRAARERLELGEQALARLQQAQTRRAEPREPHSRGRSHRRRRSRGPIDDAHCLREAALVTLLVLLGARWTRGHRLRLRLWLRQRREVLGPVRPAAADVAVPRAHLRQMLAGLHARVPVTLLHRSSRLFGGGCGCCRSRGVGVIVGRRRQGPLGHRAARR